MADVSVEKHFLFSPISDVPDQFLFFGAFGAGAAAIWFLKNAGINQYIVTTVPVALMAGYIVISLLTKRFRLREDKVGDNIYYLGFLYTLTSLAHSLHTYNPNGSSATNIITNFGIAIFTTILGLAGRVFFNQMREDPIEYEREARYSLGEAARELRAQLADISTDFSQFKRNIVQITEEGVSDVTASARNSMAENVKLFSESGKEVIEAIRRAFDQFTDHSSKLTEMGGKNVEALQALFDRIQSIEASPTLVAEKLQPIADKFAEIADDAMRRNRNQTNDLKRVQATVEAAVKASEMLRTSISRMDAAAKDRIEALGSGYQDILEKAREFAGTLESSGNLFARDVGTTREKFEELLSLLKTELETANQFRREIEADLAIVRQHRTGMAELAQESRDSVQSVQRSLVSLSQTIVEQVGGHQSR